ncbi:MAG: hypothetical protein A3B37_02445 [Candidatus Sungbacteria bacterium RIFCSPLOWO2_01_FULL_59_16]|uniref:Carbonic anhydrase n=1 Tax=Candidatus Sungbacteria bacterium RIFCSPLOWO2_01_FULL_59_16 TaxID=1802280 RepID=A0A1G2LF13_9BACT|nr:MAG: hypothetical protein A3B37_02445 [Candidatus Sungbacteria bacterium RIFCSPLOWO2_01_FULL_59_16]
MKKTFSYSQEHWNRERVIECAVDPKHYHADTCAVWCFDDRFSPALERLMAETQTKHIDLVKVAGGARGLASPANENERAYLLDQIAKSIKLHEPKTIWLMVHADCGAYGNPKFENAEAETTFFGNELANAENTVGSFFGKNGITMPIQKYFADFKGIVEI